MFSVLSSYPTVKRSNFRLKFFSLHWWDVRGMICMDCDRYSGAITPADFQPICQKGGRALISGLVYQSALFLCAVLRIITLVHIFSFLHMSKLMWQLCTRELSVV